MCTCGACLCLHSSLSMKCIGQKKLSDVLSAMHTLICSLETECLTDLGLVTQSCNLSTCELELSWQPASPEDPSVPNSHSAGVAEASKPTHGFVWGAEDSVE